MAGGTTLDTEQPLSPDFSQIKLHILNKADGLLCSNDLVCKLFSLNLTITVRWFFLFFSLFARRLFNRIVKVQHENSLFS